MPLKNVLLALFVVLCFICGCGFNPSGGTSDDDVVMVDAMPPNDGVIPTDAPVDAPPLQAQFTGGCQWEDPTSVTSMRSEKLVCMAIARSCAVTINGGNPMPLLQTAPPDGEEWTISFTPQQEGVHTLEVTCSGDPGTAPTPPVSLELFVMDLTVEGAQVIDPDQGTYRTVNRTDQIRLRWKIPDEPSTQFCSSNTSHPTFGFPPGPRPCAGTSTFFSPLPLNGQAETVRYSFSSTDEASAVVRYRGEVSVAVPASMP